MSYGTSFFSTEQLYKELRRRLDEKDSLQENNYYQRFIEDVQQARIESLEEELRALEQDYEFLRRERQVRSRPTEPLE
jgi:restriction endonuclease S subunit